MTAPERLAASLREQILDGALAPGTPLREQRLSAEHDLARHTVRTALRALAAEGLVRVEPNRGARVARLDRAELEALGELRVALEVEGARLALARNGGALPASVHEACARLRAACARGAFADVTRAHEALHAGIVEAGGSPRIAAAHRALAGELRLFLVQLRPAWDVGNLAAEHDALVAALERDGPDVLRDHIEASTRALTEQLRS
jgi:DNA-binding GntR family transcriptional regulator